MRLYELKGWDELRLPVATNKELVPVADRILSVLEKFGYKKLGQGKKGVVLEHPGKPFVYKIFTEDMCYYNFVKFCKSNKNNPHLPKILSPIYDLNQMANRRDKEINAVHSVPLMIKMEKLDKLSEQEFYSDKEFIWFIDKVFHKKMPFGIEEREFEDGVFRWMKDNRQLAQTLVAINTELSSGCSVDVSPSSFMKRGDIIVVADPVY